MLSSFKPSFKFALANLYRGNAFSVKLLSRSVITWHLSWFLTCYDLSWSVKYYPHTTNLWTFLSLFLSISCALFLSVMVTELAKGKSCLIMNENNIWLILCECVSMRRITPINHIYFHFIEIKAFLQFIRKISSMIVCLLATPSSFILELIPHATSCRI